MTNIPPSDPTPTPQTSRGPLVAIVALGVVAALAIGGVMIAKGSSKPLFKADEKAFCTSIDAMNPATNSGKSLLEQARGAQKAYEAAAVAAPNQATYDAFHASAADMAAILANPELAKGFVADNPSALLKNSQEYKQLLQDGKALTAALGSDAAVISKCPSVISGNADAAASSAKNAAEDAFANAQGSGVGVTTANIFSAYTDGGASATSIPSTMTAGSGGVVKYAVTINGTPYNNCETFSATPGTAPTFVGAC